MKQEQSFMLVTIFLIVILVVGFLYTESLKPKGQINGAVDQPKNLQIKDFQIPTLSPEDKKNSNVPDIITPTPAQQQLKSEFQINKDKMYKVILKTTEGNIAIRLNPKMPPVTVANFIGLSRKKFYNNTIFHRVIAGFMIQGGDPRGDGSGGPGYTFDDELFEGEYARGAVAMAKAGPNTNGSQFFIMHKDNLDLPKSYMIFGHVIEGIDVVDKIATARVEKNAGGEMSKPINPVMIKDVEVIEEENDL